MMELLFKQAIEKKLFTALDLHLGLFLAEKANLSDLDKQRFHFLVSYLSAETRAGHVCLSLSQLTSSRIFNGRETQLVTELLQQLNLPDVVHLVTLLLQSEVVSDGQLNTPLILQNDRLYFQRMWIDEQKVADYFREASQVMFADSQELPTILTELFPDSSSDEIDWQKIAVAIALTRQVAIISGGPGTGKTTTVAKLLAALITAKSEQVKPLRIMAAAPTGKAAARLTQSLTHAVKPFISDELAKLSLPSEAVTLHRLLGAQLNEHRFLYHRDNPLHLDILIIDEASMVDLSMMASVIDALPPHARLILLGDRDQLSSVEAGAVLGDLCYFAHGDYSKQRAKELEKLTGFCVHGEEKVPSIADNICLLQKSYRFDAHSGIGQLAGLVNQGKSKQALQLLSSQTYSDIVLNPFFSEQDYQPVIDDAVHGYSHYLQYIQAPNFDIKEALDTFAQFRLLAALREGLFGVKGLNIKIEQALAKKGLINLASDEAWYIGRPVMILKNHPGLGLYNGDIGITLPSTSDATKKRVYFQLADGSVQGFSPYRLPLNETAFVMTVHKSQGSEFDHTALILPPEFSPILTRSLLYTAITRAKQKMTLYSNVSILERTIHCQIERETGLINSLGLNSTN